MSIKLKNQIVKKYNQKIDDKLMSIYDALSSRIEEKFFKVIVPLINDIDELFATNSKDLILISDVLFEVSDFMENKMDEFDRGIEEIMNELIDEEDVYNFIHEEIEGNLMKELAQKCYTLNINILQKELMLFRRKNFSKSMNFFNMSANDFNNRYLRELVEKAESLQQYAKDILEKEIQKRACNNDYTSEEAGETNQTIQKQKIFTSKDMSKFLKDNGFEAKRQNSTSHKIFYNRETNKTVVCPQGRTIKKGLSFEIQKQALGI